MCGILAHVAFQPGAKISQPHLKALNELQWHRGPDSGGVYLQGPVGLAVRRLSIIDLEKGDQPITSADGRYTIVFNGEIYNHDELRRNLLNQGYPLKTRSDTETLLYSYIDQGPACLKSLNGMFAFAIWDENQQQLFVARDRLGIKPLYYAQNQERILFSSELTPIYASGFFDLRFDLKAISDYLAYWYICEPRTIFQDVYQLTPGTYAILGDGELKKFCYWQVPAEKEADISFTSAREQLQALIQDSVKLRMKVDVPIGTFLSGGIDSGIITALAGQDRKEELTAFCIGFPQETYSEVKEATLTARRYGVNLRVCQLEEMTAQRVQKVLTAFDEPLGNASYVPTFFLAEAARKELKVVLTGDGGDELFGGYPTYQAPYYQTMYQQTPRFLRRIGRDFVNHLPVSHNRISLDYRLKQLWKGLDHPFDRAHYTWREVASLHLQHRLFRPEYREELEGYDPFSVAEFYFKKGKALSVKNQLMYADLHTYLLNDHLRKIDRMTMAHSLEARLPYLDYRIVELAMRMPADFKVTFRQTKRILKDLARDYLPTKIIKGTKKGLTSPIAHWISSDLKSYVTEELQGGLLAQFFDREFIQTLMAEHAEKTFDHSRTIWALLTLQVWGKKFRLLSRSLKEKSFV